MQKRIRLFWGDIAQIICDHPSVTNQFDDGAELEIEIDDCQGTVQGLECLAVDVIESPEENEEQA